MQADSTATLRGRRPSYREALLAVRERLEVQCPCGLATQDLETGATSRALVMMLPTNLGPKDSGVRSIAKYADQGITI